jgi:hypothetical protein
VIAAVRAWSPPGAIFATAACSAARMRSTRAPSSPERSLASAGSSGRWNSSVRLPSISFQSSAVQARSDDQRQLSRPKRLSA